MGSSYMYKDGLGLFYGTYFLAFDENHGFRDFRVSVIIYCP